MATITQQDVSRLVEDIHALYIPDREACGKATPAQMRLLVERLADYTERVKKAASEFKLVTEWYDPWTGTLKSTGSKYNPMFAVDMANWEQRLSHYRRFLDAVPDAQANDVTGCELIYKQVTAPLLDGIYYEAHSGLNLNDEERARISSGQGHPNTDVMTTVNGKDHPPGHSNAKPPDVISPFTLGNQVLVWKDHQDERLREFWTDLKEGAIALPKSIADGISKGAQNVLNPFGRGFLMPLGVALLGLSAVVITGMVVVNRSKSKRYDLENDRELNPGRRGKKSGALSRPSLIATHIEDRGPRYPREWTGLYRVSPRQNGKQYFFSDLSAGSSRTWIDDKKAEAWISRTDVKRHEDI